MAISDWSTTAADNDDADIGSGIDWREGMSPGQLNNTGRAMMAVLKAWYDSIAAGNNGSVINSAFAEYATYSTISAVIPADDTPPLSTEGTQILSVSLTPSATTNKIRGLVSVPFSLDAPSAGVIAVFRGTTLVKSRGTNVPAAAVFQEAVFEFEDAPATTAAVTYTVRAGKAAAGSLYLNGISSGRIFGGSQSASIHLKENKA